MSPAFLSEVSFSPPGNTDYTADANCQGAWFLNGAATETDRSGSLETLTETSGTIPTSTDVPSGYSGTSRAFAAADTEYLVGAADGSANITGADQHISVVAWVKPASILNGGVQGVVGKWDRGSGHTQYIIDLWGSAANTYQVEAKVGTKTLVSTTTNYAVGSWKHVALVYNDTDLRVYIDGELNRTSAYTSGMTSGTTAAFAIGASFNDGAQNRQFDGLIDEVAIFDRALSAEEIGEIYNNGIDGTRGGND